MARRVSRRTTRFASGFDRELSGDRRRASHRSSGSQMIFVNPSAAARTRRVATASRSRSQQVTRREG